MMDREEFLAEVDRIYALCPRCQREMRPAVTCIETVFVDSTAAVAHHAIPYGDAAGDLDAGLECNDCSVSWGGYHHAV